MSKKIKSYLLWAVIIISILGIFISPKEKLVDQIITTLPWVATGVLLSEIILTAGFLLMLSIAAPAIVRSLTKSIKNAIEGLIELKETVRDFDWSHVAGKCNRSKVFWLGFWLSVVGAAGDGVVLIIGIGRALPIASWGLMVLPFWDLSLTYIIRRAIHRGVKKDATAPSAS